MKNRLLLTRREAAEALNMSLSHFQRHVQPHLRCVYSGQLRLYLRGDLERWVERSAHEPAAQQRTPDGRRRQSAKESAREFAAQR